MLSPMLSGAGMAKVRSIRPRERRVSADYLRAWLDHLGLKQADLARRLGVTQPTVSKWVNKRNAISMDQVIAIAEALDIDDTALFSWPGTSEADALDNAERQAIQRLKTLDVARRKRVLRGILLMLDDEDDDSTNESR